MGFLSLTFSSRAKTHSLCICKIHGTKARGGEIIYYSLTVFLILNSFCQITLQRIPSSFQYLIFFFFTVHYTHSLNQICSTLEVIIRYSPRATIAEYIMGLCCGRKAGRERERENSDEVHNLDYTDTNLTSYPGGSGLPKATQA